MAAKKRKKSKPRPAPRKRKPAKARPKPRPRARPKPRPKPKPRPRKTAAFRRCSAAAKKGWARRRLREDRAGYAPNEGGTARPGLSEEDRHKNIGILRRMVLEDHYAWEKFVERGMRAGLDRREIVNLWFSPKAKPKR